MNKKLLRLFLIVVIMLLIPNVANAKGKEYFYIDSISDDNYFVNLYIIYKDEGKANPEAIAGRELNRYSIYGESGTIGIDDKYPYYCEYQWEDPEYIIQEGVQTVIVNAKTVKNKELTIKLTINGITEDEYNNQLIDESGIVLNKSNLLIKIKEKFDINIKNKIKGSSYKWTTSNKKVATINNKNGVVTGVKKGKAVITCTITTPDGRTVKLKCNVTIK